MDDEYFAALHRARYESVLAPARVIVRRNEITFSVVDSQIGINAGIRHDRQVQRALEVALVADVSRQPDALEHRRVLVQLDRGDVVLELEVVVEDLGARNNGKKADCECSRRDPFHRSTLPPPAPTLPSPACGTSAAQARPWPSASSPAPRTAPAAWASSGSTCGGRSRP